jgi:hypothetical protein
MRSWQSTRPKNKDGEARIAMINMDLELSMAETRQSGINDWKCALANGGNLRFAHAPIHF